MMLGYHMIFDVMCLSHAPVSAEPSSFALVGRTIAGKRSNDCWNDVQDFNIPLRAAVLMQSGGSCTQVAGMARGAAATQLVRVKKEQCHVHR
ncbi:hypothetical protein B5P45_07050 [Phyllobacterium zundukense]|uniref:Uncharacterized protein n=2 Tax=Phyllobacterium zundukense TaxID=1867719 RepID=A0A2N9W1X1_9HYPH|nr:hypothetical protein [Phyllobacterium zundukense]ATU91491.1 hypothetical protein BLM14_07485 [Phyllobacterium zundukense]PIO45739.1 hypothetical protein B5P45_07050 [Phyllobacterium zundukense]